ncbi:MAG: hypothetical protein JWO80_6567, partial [Bryobacterales bacterium]|nr:hypothetical protein [Bryobacterales bacterium]
MSRERQRGPQAVQQYIGVQRERNMLGVIE